MRSILITGGLTNQGIELTEYLLKNTNHLVVCVDNLNNINNENNEKLEKFKNEKNYVFLRTHLVNSDCIEFLIYTYCVDTVVHFNYDFNSSELPRLMYENTFSLTLLLDLCVKYNVDNFYTITDEIRIENSIFQSPELFTKSQICSLITYYITNHKKLIVILKSVEDIKNLVN